MTFEGTITYISDEQLIGEKQLPKISFVLEELTDREYKSSIMIEILGEKISLIKPYKVGDTIKAHLNFKASEYNGRRYNRIGMRKVENATGGSTGGSSSSSSNDDLPF